MLSSPEVTNSNEFHVNRIIQAKMNCNTPYYATDRDMNLVVNDMDHFPYRRFYRADQEASLPVVMEREAGFRPRRELCYRQRFDVDVKKPTFCWEFPCSTFKPCKSNK